MNLVLFSGVATSTRVFKSLFLRLEATRGKCLPDFSAAIKKTFEVFRFRGMQEQGMVCIVCIVS